MSNVKSGAKDTGSVGDLKGAGSVNRNESTHDKEFASGGSTKMFGEQQAEPMKSGQTGDPGGTGKGAEFAKGGSGKMFGFRASENAKAGITSAC